MGAMGRSVGVGLPGLLVVRRGEASGRGATRLELGGSVV